MTKDIIPLKTEDGQVTHLTCEKGDVLSIETTDGKEVTGIYIGLSNLYSKSWNIVISVEQWGDEYIPIDKMKSITLSTPRKEKPHMKLEKVLIKAKYADWRINPAHNKFIIGILININDKMAIYPLNDNDAVSINAIEIDKETIREWTGLYDINKIPVFNKDKVLTIDEDGQPSMDEDMSKAHIKKADGNEMIQAADTAGKRKITENDFPYVIEMDYDIRCKYLANQMKMLIIDDDPEPDETVKNTVPSSTLCNEIIETIRQNKSKGFDGLSDSIIKGAMKKAEEAVTEVCRKYSDVSTKEPEPDYKIGDVYWTIEYIRVPKMMFITSRVTNTLLEIKDILTNTTGKRFLIVENKTGHYKSLISEDEFKNTCRANPSELHRDIDKIIEWKNNR